MPKDFPRARRVADAIQQHLAELIRREVKDPRVGVVTITAVEVSNDLAHAKVYLSSWEGAERVREAIVGLERAKGFLRQHLAKRLTTYKVPQLHFLYDTSIERGVALTQLIDRVAAERRASDAAPTADAGKRDDGATERRD
ncbi:30S ribosome-binding factor RbfA [Hydrogenophilus thiooxidans]|uniref:30S ribosome-binding factor RbfA n=1 Tax=Hydrogenophilus thiooxidans TaxID=2820326 RepID=UPI001C24C713|nr:30S ribosome-binding factor RbfA [Hydrogenophilus thiooxidans]